MKYIYIYIFINIYTKYINTKIIDHMNKQKNFQN